MRRVYFFVMLVSWLGHCSLGYAQSVYRFEGQIDFLKKTGEIFLQADEGSRISLRLGSKDEKEFQLNVLIDHWTTPLFVITTELEGSAKIGTSPDSPFPTIQGTVKSRYSLINFKPSREMAGVFEIRDRTLYLHSLSLGNVTCHGSMGLVAPYPVDFLFNISAMELADFLSFWTGEGYELHAEGLVSGEIQTTGNSRGIFLRANLDSYVGTIEEFQYDSMIIHLEGVYPLLQLSSSRVTQADGLSFSVSGNVDLSDKENFQSQIITLEKSPLVREGDAYAEWTIKRKESEKQRATTELKYLLRHGDKSGLLKEDSDMLGIERSINF